MRPEWTNKQVKGCHEEAPLGPLGDGDGGVVYAIEILEGIPSEQRAILGKGPMAWKTFRYSGVDEDDAAEVSLQLTSLGS